MITLFLIATLMSHSFTVNWSGHDGTEAYFAIEEQGPLDSSFGEILRVGPEQQSVCIDVVGNPGDQFFYRVGGYNGQGLIAYSNVTTGTIPNPVPLSPSNLSLVMVGRSWGRLTWDDNSDNETEMRVYQTDRKGVFRHVATLMADATSYVVTGLKKNWPNCFKVSAANGTGESPLSSQVCT